MSTLSTSHVNYMANKKPIHPILLHHESNPTFLLFDPPGPCRIRAIIFTHGVRHRKTKTNYNPNRNKKHCNAVLGQVGHPIRQTCSHILSFAGGVVAKQLIIGMVLQVWNKEPQQQQQEQKQGLNMTTEANGSTTTSNANTAMTTSVGKDKKKKGLLNIKSPFKFISGGSGGKTYCRGCKKKCSGEVLRVNDYYFHTQCFKCKDCGVSLSQGGFFTKNNDYYCSKCYQSHYGTKCGHCGLFVEGEVVTALGKTYHQNCFTCAGCGKPFPAGERVTFTGKNCLCQRCVRKNNADGKSSPQKSTVNGTVTTGQNASSNGGAADDLCGGCGDELRDGQALMALDKQYHVWCFKCKACDMLLHGEYMGKDGHPYCEKDYQARFGVKCTYCRRFISGKVLQAGDNNHFHPTCARCTKCGDPFGDGEEMFLQGAAIWHPRCGPGPDEANGLVVNGFESSHNNNNTFHSHIDESASMASAGFYGSRASSPGAGLRRGPDAYYDSGRFSRSTIQMPGSASVNYYPPHYGGLYSSSSTYSLRRPIEPGDRLGSMASINHFHLPPSRRASSSSRNYHTSQAQRMSVENLMPSSAAHRPISCPPKPGYTHSARGSSAISPGPGMHFNDFKNQEDLISQQSFRTDMTDPHYYSGIRGSHTYSHGFRTPLPGRPSTPSIFTGEHKIYPIHMILTSNYKMLPDLDRCNLEKHLGDADFEMAFNMSRDQFYSLPMWRRNDLKRRMKLF